MSEGWQRMAIARRPRTCYLTAPAGLDLRSLRAVVREQGWILDEAVGLPASVGIDPEAIHGADVVVAIVESLESSGRSLFEAGFARGLGKTVVVIGPKTLKLPNAEGLLHIAANLRDETTLRFSLNHVLTSSETRRRKKTVRKPTTAPLGMFADALLSRVRTGELRESDLEQVVKEALSFSGVIVQAGEKELPNGRPDFVAWVDELEDLLGNPFLIEVKARLAPPSAGWADALLSYLERASARSLLILYDAATHALEHDLARIPAQFWLLDIRSLIQGMRDSDFGSVIRESAIRGRDAGQLWPA